MFLVFKESRHGVITLASKPQIRTKGNASLWTRPLRKTAYGVGRCWFI